jgi:Ornithine cyclodeaminase/mu-crystallin family
LFVDFEGEIQKLDHDHLVTELWEVIAGKAPGRRDEREITHGGAEREWNLKSRMRP